MEGWLPLVGRRDSLYSGTLIVSGLSYTMHRYLALSSRLQSLPGMGALATHYIVLYAGLHPITLFMSIVALRLDEEFEIMTADILRSSELEANPIGVRLGQFSRFFPKIEQVLQFEHWSMCQKTPRPLTRCIYAPDGVESADAIITVIDYISGDEIQIARHSKIEDCYSRCSTIWRMTDSILNSTQERAVCVHYEKSKEWPSDFKDLAALCEARPLRKGGDLLGGQMISWLGSSPMGIQEVIPRPRKRRRSLLNYFSVE